MWLTGCYMVNVCHLPVDQKKMRTLVLFLAPLLANVLLHISRNDGLDDTPPETFRIYGTLYSTRNQQGKRSADTLIEAAAQIHFLLISKTLLLKKGTLDPTQMQTECASGVSFKAQQAAHHVFYVSLINGRNSLYPGSHRFPLLS